MNQLELLIQTQGINSALDLTIHQITHTLVEGTKDD